MPRPGVDVIIGEPSPIAGAVLDFGQAFFLGTPKRGPNVPTRLRSLRDYETIFGPRQEDPDAYNGVRGYFSEQGGTLHFLRLVGDDAEAAEGDLGDHLHVTANSPGAWGNDLSVALVAAATLLRGSTEGKERHPNRRRAKAAAEEGTPPPIAGGATNGDEPVRVNVLLNGEVVEVSPIVTLAGEAAAWSAVSRFVTLAVDEGDEDEELEPVAAVRLAGGKEGSPLPVGDALDKFPHGMGPAQVAYPGATDAATHTAILDHCDKYKRCAVLDLAYEDDATMAGDAQGLWMHPGSRWAAGFAPRLRVTGYARGTTIAVPYSALQCGIISRSDRATGNPNAPAAGVNGRSLSAISLDKDWSDDVREELNDLGISLAKVINGEVRTYGARTLAGPGDPDWQWFGGSRTVMAISYECDAIAENYVHRQIDAQRTIFDKLEQELGGVCGRYYAELHALYGETAAEAFQVDAGPSVNTDETILDGQIRAVIKVKTSPTGEWVVIEIQKYPIHQQM